MEKFDKLEAICVGHKKKLEHLIVNNTQLSYEYCDAKFEYNKIKFRLYDYNYAGGEFPLCVLVFTPFDVKVDITLLEEDPDVKHLKAEWLKFYHEFKHETQKVNQEEEVLNYEG